MQIANPIYDVVFKFLMEDSRAAKSLLSALIQQEIIELDFLPQEMTAEVGTVSKNRVQSLNREENFHILKVNENDFPENNRHIIRRLQAAKENEDLREKMIAEDDFMSELPSNSKQNLQNISIKNER
jgi:hypothetical protein